MAPHENKKKIYGWFSKEASNVHEHIVTYKTKFGSNVIISCITDNPHDSGTAFNDIQFIGEVDSWVSTIPNPKFKLLVF